MFKNIKLLMVFAMLFAVAGIIFAAGETFTENVIQANNSGSYADMIISVTGVPTDGQVIVVGTCAVTFSTAADELDCGGTAQANIKMDDAGESATTIANSLDGLINVSGDDGAVHHGDPITVNADTGLTTKFIATAYDDGDIPVDLSGVSVMGVSHTAGQAQVQQIVDFTPSAANEAGVIYEFEINGTNTTSYTTIAGTETVQTVVEGLIANINSGPTTCTEDNTKVTCSADIIGTAFTYDAYVDIPGDGDVTFNSQAIIGQNEMGVFITTVNDDANTLEASDVTVGSFGIDFNDDDAIGGAEIATSVDMSDCTGAAPGVKNCELKFTFSGNPFADTATSYDVAHGLMIADDAVDFGLGATVGMDNSDEVVADSMNIPDGQHPTILDSFTEDTDGNGKIDTIGILFSERMDNSVSSSAGLSMAGYIIAGTGTWSADINIDDFFEISVTEKAGACSFTDQTGCDTGATPNVSYALASGLFVDVAANDVNDYGPTPAVDEAAPVALGGKAVSDTSIEVKFSENMSDDVGPPSYLPNPAGFTATGIVVTAATTRVADDTFIDLTVNSLNNTAFTANDLAIAGDAAYDYDENGTNLQSGLSISDGQSPVIISIEYRRILGSLANVDSYRLDFSEDINFVGSNAGYLSGHTVTANDLTNFFGSPDSVSVGVDYVNHIMPVGNRTNNLTGVSGGTEPTVTYVNDGVNYYQDSSGNQVESFTDLILDDGVRPEILFFDSSNADDTYGPSSIINVRANYSEDIASGSLTVDLNNTYDNLLLNTVSGSTIFSNFNTGATGSGYDTSDLSVSSIEAATQSAMDAAGNSNTGTTMPSVNIDDNQDIVVDVTAPIITSLATASMNENQTAAIDVDGTDDTLPLAFAKAGGIDSGLFNLNVLTGEYSFMVAPDYETPGDANTDNDYEFDVRVSDDVGNSVDQSITVTVNDVNEFSVTTPTDTDGDANTVAEDAGAGVVVEVTAYAQDADGTTNTVTYSFDHVDDSAGGRFQIDANSGVVTTTAVGFDFETDASHIILVRATSTDTSFAEESFTIDVIDVNAAPTDIGIGGTLIDENEPIGTVVGGLGVTDDGEDGAYVYSLMAGAGDEDNANFLVNGTNLELNFVPDYESPTDLGDTVGNNTYSIRLNVNDGAHDYAEVFVITINDLNTDPTAIALDSQNVDEELAIGTVVGNLSNTDDGEDNPVTYTYSLFGPSADNVSFNIVGTELRTAEEFDFETKASYSIGIQVSDGNGVYDDIFNIDINDTVESSGSSRKRTSSSTEYTCKDSKALNFSSTGAHKQELCIYEDIGEQENQFKGEKCSLAQTLTQNLKTGDRNGKYSSWAKATITEAKILQAHLNRLGFSSGAVDGILGPITDGAIKRMQAFLGVTQDGYVGPKTRLALNNSCID